MEEAAIDLKEQAIIDLRTEELKNLHHSYLASHPEIEQLLNDFTAEVLMHKPIDVIGFAKDYFAKFNPSPIRTKPLAVVGPSGTGKTTIITCLIQVYEGAFELSISCTTRPKLPEEQEGVDYFFITKEEFERKIQENDFIEYGEVNGQMYGTSAHTLRDIADRGKICLMDIDIQGAIRVYDSGLEFNRVFILPKNMKQLEQRMRKRGEIEENAVRSLLRQAQNDIEMARANPNLFTDVVTNDNFEVAMGELDHFILRYYEFLKDVKS